MIAQNLLNIFYFILKIYFFHFYWVFHFFLKRSEILNVLKNIFNEHLTINWKDITLLWTAKLFVLVCIPQPDKMLTRRKTYVAGKCVIGKISSCSVGLPFVRLQFSRNEPDPTTIIWRPRRRNRVFCCSIIRSLCMKKHCRRESYLISIVYSFYFFKERPRIVFVQFSLCYSEIKCLTLFFSMYLNLCIIITL